MRYLFACVLLLLGLPAASADWVLHNGKLWTGDAAQPAASALAVKDGRIIGVGGDAEMLALAGERAQRIDLKGRRVIPGINDAHVHLGAWWKSTYLQLPSPDPSRSELEAALRAQPRAGEDWISATIGGQIFNDGNFNISTLDALQSTRPVILQAMTGHGTLVNSAAQRLLKVDPSIDVPGGWYGKDASGRFDGRLYEYAQWRMRISQPALTDEAEIADLRAYAAETLKYGTTSVQAMAMLPTARMAQLWQRSKVPQRLRLIRIPIPARWGEPVDAAALGSIEGAPRLLVSGTKWILDGTPIEHGAATHASYPNTGTNGHLNFDQGQIEALLREIIARNDQPLLHITGDRTASVVLETMAKIAPASEWRKRRLRFEHGDGLRGDMLARAKEYGVIVVQNPSHFAFPNDYMSGSLLSGLLDAGIPVALGSDGPANPWINMMWAVQPPVAPAQGLSREQVLMAYTGGSAWAEFEESRKGKLAVGYLADLAVLSQDVLDESIPAQALPGTNSLLTMIDGEVVWQDPAY